MLQAIDREAAIVVAQVFELLEDAAGEGSFEFAALFHDQHPVVLCGLLERAERRPRGSGLIGHGVSNILLIYAPAAASGSGPGPGVAGDQWWLQEWAGRAYRSPQTCAQDHGAAWHR
ncbi:MAG: hypothetical protein Ct9H300mP12_09200 [Acidimicrobiales bacterium]|nr:MAG: hypothetical protein Ct9H300mP12_09200 [Acidimicrobiales bacterium]